ncbi:MAG TPA: DNA recombination protein RmuC [Alphaproteobacteria bacterium]|nr:DNA recombination protein RmuC [Alphaproteobacteria bacterium]
MLLYGALGLFAVLLAAVVVLLWRQSQARTAEAAERRAEAEAAAARAAATEQHLAHLMQVQNEMTGRMQTMAEIFGTRTSDLARMLNERLDAQGQRVGQAIQETNTRTAESLSKLAERLAVIDRAQSNIAQLSQDVVSLQAILANKQTRGAFGQGRMEAIIVDQLAPGTYQFQFELSNRSRPDCVIFMPNSQPPLVIDAKFPLESWQRLGAAQTQEELRAAAQAFRRDMGVHVQAIAEKYLIAGETQDTAFLFVPSESIFADIHEKFDDIVQRAVRARVMIVSPSILMLSIQVMQALLRDVRMREEAHKIQKEVCELLLDVNRMDERVRKLQQHFLQANNDIGDILTSSGKVVRRGERIEAMDFDDREPQLRLAGE